MFWICCLWLVTQPRIIETELFHPLAPGEVQVSADGQIFILNFSEGVITRYGSGGEKVNTIGFKGEGPGGLIEPDAFFLEGARVFVLDKRDSAIEIFDFDGTFKNQVPLPHRKITLAKVIGGWVIGDWETRDDDQPPEIFLTGESFQNPKKVHTLSTRGKYQGLYTRGTPGKFSHVFVPVTTEPKMLVNPQGTQVFIAESDSAKITRITVADGTVTTIETGLSAIPFDREWAESRLDLYLGNMREKISKSHVNMLAPDYFPRIRNLKMTPRGYLAITRWAGNPGVQIPLIAWDLERNGKVQDYNRTWAQLSRVIAVNGQTAFISDFDSEAEIARVVCLPVSNMWQYLDANPIVFRGMTVRTLGSDY